MQTDRHSRFLNRSLPFSIQKMLVKMVTDQMQKFCRPLFTVPDLKNGFVEVAEVCVQRSFHKLNDLTELDITAIETSHLVKRIDQFDQADL